MQLIRHNQTETFKNGASCTAIEYPTHDTDINVAVVKLTGRYPATGRVVNAKSKEVCFVTEGSGSVTVDGKEVPLQTGDLVSIEPGEKFFWDGAMTVLISSAPAWHPGQYREVE